MMAAGYLRHRMSDPSGSDCEVTHASRDPCGYATESLTVEIGESTAWLDPCHRGSKEIHLAVWERRRVPRQQTIRIDLQMKTKLSVSLGNDPANTAAKTLLPHSTRNFPERGAETPIWAAFFYLAP